MCQQLPTTHPTIIMIRHGTIIHKRCRPDAMKYPPDSTPTAAGWHHRNPASFPITTTTTTSTVARFHQYRSNSSSCNSNNTNRAHISFPEVGQSWVVNGRFWLAGHHRGTRFLLRPCGNRPRIRHFRIHHKCESRSKNHCHCRRHNPDNFSSEAGAQTATHHELHCPRGFPFPETFRPPNPTTPHQQQQQPIQVQSSQGYHDANPGETRQRCRRRMCTRSERR